MRLMFMMKRHNAMPSAPSTPTVMVLLDEGRVSLLAQAVPRYSLRRFWLRTHLYLGLFGGALFVLMSLTGSFLVFYKAIDEWMNPAQLTTSGSGPYKSLNEVVETAQAAAPPGGWLDSLELPSHERDVFHAWFKLPKTKLDQVMQYQVTIDPYSGTVLSQAREWGGHFVSFVYELHQSLLLDHLGETIVGFVAIALLISIGTGVYLWWPSPSRIREAFTFKSGGTVIRHHYQWHKVSGFYSAIALATLAFTGVYLEFGEYLIPIVRFFSPVQEFSEVHSIPIPGTSALSVEQAVTRGRQIFPAGELRYISLPHDDTDIYQLTFRQLGEVRKSGGQSEVWLDQYSGSVLRVVDWNRFSSGEIFLAWLFPLHNGEAFGLVGRWIVCVSGFVPLILYVTALRMWWLKRQAHRRLNRRLTV